MMKNADYHLVTNIISDLGEGPSWDDERHRLYWVDITGQQIHIWDLKLNESRSIQTGQWTGCVVPSHDDELICALHKGFYKLDLNTEGFSEIGLPGERDYDLSVNRFNDGKCDAYGRFWAGTTSFEEEYQKGCLFYLDTDQKIHLVRRKVTVSNGMGWSPDNQIMYYIDSGVRQVFAYDFDLETATLRNERVLIDFAHEFGNPDGMAVDVEGMLWIAHWDGYEISRWNPKTGLKIEKYALPVARVTSCAFGGDALDELYITSARYGLSTQQLAEQPLAGRLFVMKTSTRGISTYRFGG